MKNFLLKEEILAKEKAMVTEKSFKKDIGSVLKEKMEENKIKNEGDFRKEIVYPILKTAANIALKLDIIKEGKKLKPLNILITKGGEITVDKNSVAYNAYRKAIQNHMKTINLGEKLTDEQISKIDEISKKKVVLLKCTKLQIKISIMK